MALTGHSTSARILQGLQTFRALETGAVLCRPATHPLRGLLPRLTSCRRGTPFTARWSPLGQPTPPGSPSVAHLPGICPNCRRMNMLEKWVLPLWRGNWKRDSHPKLPREVDKKWLYPVYCTSLGESLPWKEGGRGPKELGRGGGHLPAQPPHISSPFSKPQPHTWYWWVSIFTSQLRSRKVPNYGPVVWKSSVQPWMGDTIPFDASLWSQAALAFRGSYKWLSIKAASKDCPLRLSGRKSWNTF